MASTAVFVFHRDLRLADNTTLIKAIRDGFQILPIFVFPPEQINPTQNPVFSNVAVQFMCESLLDLDRQLRMYSTRLFLFRGEYTDILNQIRKSVNFERLYSNRDESVYAHQRDKRIRAWCDEHRVGMYQEEDYGLIGLKEGLLSNGKPYTVLQQYLNRYDKDLSVRQPTKFRFSSQQFASLDITLDASLDIAKLHTLYLPNPQVKVRGGRHEGFKRLRAVKSHKDYAQNREFPGLEGTTRASAYLKFGCFSIREMYWEVVKNFGKHHGIIRELVFRDFYFKIYALQPKLQREKAFHAVLDENIPWTKDNKLWVAWTQGSTGIPLVDAGMRQLASEGWMHNRVRMVVATVATRYMLLDWRKCAKFFYSSLVDADPFSNTAGWQWSAGVGVQNTLARLRPPMNPFLQSHKYDAECSYIKKWVPELRDVPNRHIHHWYDPKIHSQYASTTSYPAPIVNPKEASAFTTKLFQGILRSHST